MGARESWKSGGIFTWFSPVRAVKSSLAPTDRSSLEFPGFWQMPRRYGGLGVQEFLRVSLRRKLAERVAKLVFELRSRDLVDGHSGIRAQAVVSDGRLLDDFEFGEDAAGLDVYNAPSPAATASLNIAKQIADRLERRFLVSSTRSAPRLADPLRRSSERSRIGSSWTGLCGASTGLLVALLTAGQGGASALRQVTAVAETPARDPEPGLAKVPSMAGRDPEGARNLLIDLERIVTSTEGGGWFLDSEAERAVHPPLMESVCRASPEARLEALRLIRDLGRMLGDPRTVFAVEQRETTRFQRARSVDRQLRALERAEQRATAECPFWVSAQDEFQSRQTDSRGISLVVETGGNLQLRYTAGQWTFGGGGLGRVLSNFGLTDHLSLLAGVEFGGGAMLRPGAPETEFVVNYFPAIPLLLRFRDVNVRYDLEVGPVALFQADNTRLSYGGRVGTSVSILALRTRNLLPWAGVAATYEYYFQGGGRPAAHFVRGGLRVGILWGG